MLEIIEGIIRGFGLLARLWAEGGLLDVSLSGTGRFFIRLLYPPHWFKTLHYHKPTECCVGLVVWSLLAYAAYAL